MSSRSRPRRQGMRGGFFIKCPRNGPTVAAPVASAAERAFRAPARRRYAAAGGTDYGTYERRGRRVRLLNGGGGCIILRPVRTRRRFPWEVSAGAGAGFFLTPGRDQRRG